MSSKRPYRGITGFNLIVTHEPGRDNYRYVDSVLNQYVEGLILVDVAPAIILYRTSDPYKVVEELKKHRSELQLVYRVIPVDIVVEPYVETVAEESSRLAIERIPEDNTYRVTLHGRLYWRETHSPAHTMDAIHLIAKKIPRKVSLSNPDYVVYIRSVKLYRRRRVATITVTKPENILSLVSGKP